MSRTVPGSGVARTQALNLDSRIEQCNGHLRNQKAELSGLSSPKGSTEKLSEKKQSVEAKNSG